MSDHAINAPATQRSWRSLVYDPKIRSIFFQLLTAGIILYFVWSFAHNAAINLARSNTASGFDFLKGRAGFDIGQSLIAYTSDSAFGRALVVGFANTMMIAIFGIITSTIIGFVVALGRLSHNWLIQKICTIYVEVFRNIPPLLVIFFLYKGVLAILPQPRDSVALPFDIFLNNRGLAFPSPIWGERAWVLPAALLAAIVAAVLIARWGHRRQMRTGQRLRSGWISLGLILGLPVLAFAAVGWPLTFDVPVVGKFNLSGGSVVMPEFVSLYLALSLYTASFIAENIRSGIKGVPKGQTEAASALGLHAGTTTRLIVVPQAMRIVIPPLTSQYLNLTKNSSLGIAVGFPELVSVGKTTMNQTGQAVEVVLIWLSVYLTLSLATSLFMNWFNAKMALVER